MKVKVHVWLRAHTLSVRCRVQSLFDSLGDEVKGKALGLGGDGRYFNKEAVQTILKLAAGAGVKKVCVVKWHDVGLAEC